MGNEVSIDGPGKKKRASVISRPRPALMKNKLY